MDNRVCYIYKIRSKNCLVKCINNTIFQKTVLSQNPSFSAIMGFYGDFFHFKSKWSNSYQLLQTMKFFIYSLIYIFENNISSKSEKNQLFIVSLFSFFSNHVTFSFGNISRKSVFFFIQLNFNCFIKIIQRKEMENKILANKTSNNQNDYYFKCLFRNERIN